MVSIEDYQDVRGSNRGGQQWRDAKVATNYFGMKYVKKNMEQ
jgi:hypothetical protein